MSDGVGLRWEDRKDGDGGLEWNGMVNCKDYEILFKCIWLVGDWDRWNGTERKGTALVRVATGFRIEEGRKFPSRPSFSFLVRVCRGGLGERDVGYEFTPLPTGPFPFLYFSCNLNRIRRMNKEGRIVVFFFLFSLDSCDLAELS